MRYQPIIYALHDYLKNNCVGFENRKKGSEIMKIFGIKDNGTFRRYIRIIRNSDVFQKIICSKAGNDGGYWLAVSFKEAITSSEELYSRGIKVVGTSSKIKKKARSDQQLRLVFAKEKGIIESFVQWIKK